MTNCPRLRLEPAKVSVLKTPNCETAITIGITSFLRLLIHIGESVRDEDVFILQTGSDNINYHLMKLFIMINAGRIASARSITAAVPCFYQELKVRICRAGIRFASEGMD